MSSHLISAILLSISILAAIVSGITQIAMLRDIRRELGQDQLRDERLQIFQLLLRQHRSLFPESNLRAILCTSLLLLLVFATGFVLALRLAHT
jgi:hypothetical protein